GAFARARTGVWQVLSVKAKEMLDNIHTPALASPWAAFLFIVNTFEVALGLEISEFRVTGPDRPTTPASRHSATVPAAVPSLRTVGLSHASSSCRLHADRIAGRDSHHRDPDWPASAGCSKGARGRRP